jgi:hypothetical protein
MDLNFVIAPATPGTFLAAANKAQLVKMDEYHLSMVVVFVAKSKANYLRSNASLAFRWKL